MSKILAVTDDPLLRRALEVELGGPVFSLTFASGFDDALRLLPGACAVIVDVDAGRFCQDGIALINELGKNAPRCGRILLAGSPLLFRARLAGRLSDRVLGRRWRTGAIREAVSQVILGAHDERTAARHASALRLRRGALAST